MSVLRIKANILVDDENNARITDFGLSRIVNPAALATGSSKGSLPWMAPELFDPDKPNNPVTTESDVWALGMTILEVSSDMSSHLR
jgi:serine/threonine protein kinase